MVDVDTLMMIDCKYKRFVCLFLMIPVLSSNRAAVVRDASSSKRVFKV